MRFRDHNYFLIKKRILVSLSIERNPFSAQNQTLRSYRVLYIYFAYKVGIISSYSNFSISH